MNQAGIKEASRTVPVRGTVWDFISVTKPRETLLLVFIGVVAALAAPAAAPLGRYFWIAAALLMASAGANGLTNYLDREIDARMPRTLKRVLPSGRIFPAARALHFTAALSASGLAISWFLHPYVFLACLIGTASAVVYRKRVTCVFPQGMIASCTPVLMGWFAVYTSLNLEIGLMCLLIAAWLPPHIWSVMLVHSGEYREAGITYFPVNANSRGVTRLLFAFSIILAGASLGIYFASAGFGLLYLFAAAALGVLIVSTSFRLMHSRASGDAWKLYKLSAFPYLGLLFLAMALDIWWKF